jgi:peptidoglycan/xylan/chitin deacetylase (PgdA/CDA1 family)
MLKILKNKQLYKNILLVIVFVLLAVSIVKNAAGIYAVSALDQPVCVPIIMYHQVKYNYLGKNAISPSEFESDLKYLSDNKYNTITMTQLIDYVYEGVDLPDNPIILSFDDGYYNTYKFVYPLLKEYNMKIVLSVIGKVTDDFSEVEDKNINYAHLTWNEIAMMQESGLVELQNHSYNLHKVCNGRYGCGQMVNEALSNYEKTITEDVLKLQDKIQYFTDEVPNTFTYPFGKYNDNTELILNNLGFKATLTVEYGVNLIRRDKPERLFGLKRICRSHNQGVSKLIKEGLKTLKYIKEE